MHPFIPRLASVAASLTLSCAAFVLAWSPPCEALPFPPGVSPEGELADAGYLDVTLYAGVDPTGTVDSTAGLQQAINDGIEYAMPVYLPSGTYLVSDTLRSDQNWDEGSIDFTLPERQRRAVLGRRS